MRIEVVVQGRVVVAEQVRNGRRAHWEIRRRRRPVLVAANKAEAMRILKGL